ncbi:hypothetical protein [Variovorax sp.]|uniref:hypothetical protein n=1 Tax=Variovorax sp. TaxID=1871043 RepID=UPI003BA9864F
MKPDSALEEEVTRVMSARYFGPKMRLSSEGLEKLCTRCDEWWPADLEFFYADPTSAGGLFYCCKACYIDRTRPPASRRASAAGDSAKPYFSLGYLLATWSNR